MRGRITIALLLCSVILISGCISSASECKPESSLVRVNIEEDSIKSCTETCRLYGIDWRTQVYGQGEDKQILCTCYQCRVI